MRKLFWPLAAVMVLAAACGGSDTAAPSLGGTAAVGAPVAGGTVTIRCARGDTLSATTSAEGAWKVELSGRSLPCIVSVTGGSIGTLKIHSIARAEGTVNVTPLTDLLVAAAVGESPAKWLTAQGTDLAGALAGLVAALPAAQEKLLESLEAAGHAVPLGDPFTLPFKPSAGDPYDDLLEAISTALANSGLTYEEFVGQVAEGGGEVEAPFTGELTAADVARMPQLNAASLTVENGALTMSTGSATNTVGAFVGGGTGNKAVLQLNGLAGLRIADLADVTIEVRKDANAVTYPYPYVSLDLTVDTQCGAPPLGASATVLDARKRYRVVTFDTYYHFIAPAGAGSGKLSATEFAALEITPATRGWRVSRADGTPVGEMEFSGSETGHGQLDFSAFPDACIADAATADAGMFRDAAAAGCDAAGPLPETAPAACGKAYSGATLFIGSSSNLRQAAWQVKGIKFNGGKRSFSFR